MGFPVTQSTEAPSSYTRKASGSNMAPKTPTPNPIVSKTPNPANSNKKPCQIYKIKPKEMEGDEIFGSIDSIWFYSGFFLPPSSKQKSNCTLGELQPRKQDPKESRDMDRDGGSSPRCIEDEEVAVGAKRRAAAGSRELDKRMEIWQEQWRQKLVVAAPARCSPSPPPTDSLAMKAHLRSWAHAVACSVR